MEGIAFWKGDGDAVSKRKGVVDIHGKQYKTVVLRVNEFRSQCSFDAGWAITTEVLARDADSVLVLACIVNPEGVIVGTGHGEEFRGSSKINKTSAVENAETSAIGRALSAIGLGGEEYASADEVLRAIQQQEEKPEKAPAKKKDKPSPVEQNDEIEEAFKKNLKTMQDKIGEEAITWHKRVMNNFFDGKKKADLDDDEMLKLIDYQKERLAGIKE